MTDQPQGRYRIQGEKGQPNMALVEIGRIGVEITEQEYRDLGYEPDFGKLPWNVGSCHCDEKASLERKG